MPEVGQRREQLPRVNEMDASPPLTGIDVPKWKVLPTTEQERRHP
jgi:hypothetical protein